MLLDSKSPLKYLIDAQKTVVYVHNRTGENSPYEQLFNEKPQNNHYVPFGSTGFAFIALELRTKLEQTLVKCRMIGCADDEDSQLRKGYKCISEEGESVFTAMMLFLNLLKLLHYRNKLLRTSDYQNDNVSMYENDSDNDSDASLESRTEPMLETIPDASE